MKVIRESRSGNVRFRLLRDRTVRLDLAGFDFDLDARPLELAWLLLTADERFLPPSREEPESMELRAFFFFRATRASLPKRRPLAKLPRDRPLSGSVAARQDQDGPSACLAYTR